MQTRPEGLPEAATYVIIGGGVHGLSTAYHLARRLRESARGARQAARIVLLEKQRVGAGASGIACGVVRNFYYQPAMNEIVRTRYRWAIAAQLPSVLALQVERSAPLQTIACTGPSYSAMTFQPASDRLAFAANLKASSMLPAV